MNQNYEIKECQFDHDFESRYGTMYSYNLTVVDVRGQEHFCYINQKEDTPAPVVGQTLYGHINDDKLGNPKFTKEQAQDGQASAPRTSKPASAPSSAPKATQQPLMAEDERQTVIVRQNALTNANSNAAARSQVFIAQKKYEEAERVLKPSAIAFIQHWFYKASMGEWRMDMKAGDALNLMGFSQEDVDAFVFERQAELEEQANKPGDQQAG